MINEDESRHSPPGAIIFVGSSIFAQWQGLPEQLGGRPVENRAVGGSTTADQVAWVEEVVLRHNPAVVVYYCGSNDLKRGVSTVEAFLNFERFASSLRQSLPDTRLVVVAVIRAPDRRAWWSRVDDYNQRLAAGCASNPNSTFVDINPAFVDDSGEPVPCLFQEDELHLLPAGYQAMAKILLPAVDAAGSLAPTESAA